MLRVKKMSKSSKKIKSRTNKYLDFECNDLRDFTVQMILYLNPRSFCNLRLTCKAMKIRCDTNLYHGEYSSQGKQKYITDIFNRLNCKYEGKFIRYYLETIISHYHTHADSDSDNDSEDDSITLIDNRKIICYYNKGLLEGPAYVWLYLGLDNNKPLSLRYSYHYINNQRHGLCHNLFEYESDINGKRAFYIHDRKVKDVKSLGPVIEQRCQDEKHKDCEYTL